MTKRTLKSLASAALALLLGATLTGCGGGGGDSVSGDAFVGQWTGVEMTIDGETMNLADYADFGLEATMEIKQDGTISVDMLGEVSTGTWKAKDASTVTITLENDPLDCKVANNRLTMADGDASIVFEKASADS